MSWWENWGRLLSNPPDNVAAAVVVLLGVVVTAAVTLLVSAANRKHERLREDRKHLFQIRAETYIEATKWLQRVSDVKRPLAELENSSADEFLDMAVRLKIYGSEVALSLFYDAYTDLVEYRAQSRIEGNDSRVAKKAAGKAIEKFSDTVRLDVQGLSKHRWFRRHAR